MKTIFDSTGYEAPDDVYTNLEHDLIRKTDLAAEFTEMLVKQLYNENCDWDIVDEALEQLASLFDLKDHENLGKLKFLREAI